MNSRLKKVIAAFPKRQIDALLVNNDTNIRYLTDYPAEESWLLVTRNEAYYITDSRYALSAEENLKGIKVVQFKRSIGKTAFDLAKTHGVKKLGFDERHVTVAQLRALKKASPKGITLAAANAVVEPLREIKDAGELAQIRKALGLHKKAHLYLRRVIKPGVTEQDVFLKLERFVKSRDAGFSFPPIVASGPNSCYPHAKITRRKVRNKEPVLVDMGMDMTGYKSDLTRMFFLGKIPKLVSEVHEAVRGAQLTALEKIKEGVAVAAVDKAARSYLERKDLAKYFGHALGHGVGLDIHEGPSLSEQSRAVLKANMVITVEPAVYLPGKFGIRLEEMVLVTKNGCKILSDDIH